jgi:hypothetical protein
VEEKGGTIKRFASVEQGGALSAKTAEEQQAHLQQLKSKLSAMTDKWRVVADVFTKLEVADVSALSDVVLENKERSISSRTTTTSHPVRWR